MLPADRAKTGSFALTQSISNSIQSIDDNERYRRWNLWTKSLMLEFQPHLCWSFSTLRNFTELCNILSEKIPDRVPLKILLCSLVDYNSRCQLFFFLNRKHRQFTKQCFGVWGETDFPQRVKFSPGSFSILTLLRKCLAVSI